MMLLLMTMLTILVLDICVLNMFAKHEISDLRMNTIGKSDIPV